jgi:hypothetical protein
MAGDIAVLVWNLPIGAYPVLGLEAGRLRERRRFRLSTASPPLDAESIHKYTIHRAQPAAAWCTARQPCPSPRTCPWTARQPSDLYQSKIANPKSKIEGPAAVMFCHQCSCLFPWPPPHGSRFHPPPPPTLEFLQSCILGHRPTHRRPGIQKTEIGQHPRTTDDGPLTTHSRPNPKSKIENPKSPPPAPTSIHSYTHTLALFRPKNRTCECIAARSTRPPIHSLTPL